MNTAEVSEYAKNLALLRKLSDINGQDDETRVKLHEQLTAGKRRMGTLYTNARQRLDSILESGKTALGESEWDAYRKEIDDAPPPEKKKPGRPKKGTAAAPDETACPLCGWSTKDEDGAWSCTCPKEEAKESEGACETCGWEIADCVCPKAEGQDDDDEDDDEDPEDEEHVQVSADEFDALILESVRKGSKQGEGHVSYVHADAIAKEHGLDKAKTLERLQHLEKIGRVQRMHFSHLTFELAPAKTQTAEQHKAAMEDMHENTTDERRARLLALVGEGKSRIEILNAVTYEFGCPRARVIEDADHLVAARKIVLNKLAGWDLPGTVPTTTEAAPAAEEKWGGTPELSEAILDRVAQELSKDDVLSGAAQAAQTTKKAAGEKFDQLVLEGRIVKSGRGFRLAPENPMD